MLVGLLCACVPTGSTPPSAPSPGTAATPSQAPQAAPSSPCAGKRASPLLLQLDATQRSALETAMARSLAVVAFDCQTLAVVESCRLAGGYEYVAGRREQIDRRISTPQEASEPLWRSATLSLEADETLELHLVAVGQRRAKVAGAAVKELEGECAAATHFIRSARVGAYHLAGQRGTTTSESSAGELSACPNAGASTAHPSSQCSAPLQVELVPIRR